MSTTQKLELDTTTVKKSSSLKNLILTASLAASLASCNNQEIIPQEPSLSSDNAETGISSINSKGLNVSLSTSAKYGTCIQKVDFPNIATYLDKTIDELSPAESADSQRFAYELLNKLINEGILSKTQTLLDLKSSSLGVRVLSPTQKYENIDYGFGSGGYIAPVTLGTDSFDLRENVDPTFLLTKGINMGEYNNPNLIRESNGVFIQNKKQAGGLIIKIGNSEVAIWLSNGNQAIN